MSSIASVVSIVDAMETALGGHTGPITYLPGAEILREGEAGASAYFIESGQVKVSKRIGGSERDIAVLGAGELIGEMAPIDGRARSATVTALTQVDLLPVGREHLETLIDQSDPLLNVMLRALFGRLRDLQARMEHSTGADGAVEPVFEPLVLDDRYRQALEMASEQVKLERALSEALRRREFVLYVQPIVSIEQRRVEGFEALIRWVRPEIGMVSPLDFVQTAERTGLIVPIGLWVLEQAGFLQQRLQNVVRAATDTERPIFITVNVSARQLRDMDGIRAMCNAIRTSGAQPEHLKLEITENALMEHADIALEGLQQFRRMGVKIAIDDFGTGYSSLSYLHRYPLDTLKVDRSFVSSMLASEQSRQLTRSIVALANGLNMDVVAEGIEREEELHLLQQMGCDYGQGYLFAKPLTLLEAERALESGGLL